MKTFLEFINEKLSRTQVDEILQDSSIIVGGEFEYISDYLEDFVQNVNGTVDIEEVDFEIPYVITDHFERYIRDELEEFFNNSDIMYLVRFSKLFEDTFRTWNKDVDSTWVSKQAKVLTDKIKKEIDTKTNAKISLEDLYEFIEDLIDIIDAKMTAEYERLENNLRYESEVDFGDEDEWLDFIKENQKEIFKDFPSNYKYQIGGYHKVGYPSKNMFNLTYDSTVSPYGGVELITAPYPLPKFLEVMNDVFDFISDTGKTTDTPTCGFHLNLSQKNQSFDNFNFLKASLLFEEGYIYQEKFFKNREFNMYAQKIGQQFKAGLKNGTKNITDFKDLMVQELQHINIDIRKEFGHSHGINFSNAKTKEGSAARIEFRYAGGKNYHSKNYNTIIAQYAELLKIGFDPKYKREEYLKKLYEAAREIEKKEMNRYYEYLLEYKLDYEGDLTKDQEKFLDYEIRTVKPMAGKSKLDSIKTMNFIFMEMRSRLTAAMKYYANNTFNAASHNKEYE